ncbi:formylmethanofuran dehydrogenase subunit C, partial [Methanocorpusculaceae archaeon]|nr:formylmethanofuran dehydrogenase subunit C [Methanocorpusculaceae archaeon]
NAGIHAGANMKGGCLIIEGDALMPCGDMFAGEANIFGTVTDFLATFREKGTAVFEGRTLTEFTGDLAHRNAKGILRVGKYIRI